MNRTHRSASVNRICEAACQHFSVHGYDSASLNEIARSVGIRKASLYAHFRNKDALFLEALDDATRIETAYAETLFDQAASGEIPGAAYVEVIADRHGGSVYLRFLLRAVFHHPVTLKARIGEVYEAFLDLLRARYERQLRQTMPRLDEADAARYGRAYVGIVESLFVELNYSYPQPVEIRREALWSVLQDSLTLKAARTDLS